MALTFDARKNFAYTVVATPPSPPSSGTSIVVATGDGTKFPTPPFNIVVWPSGVQPSTTNAEIMRVTNVATDTFTVTRAQEGTSARTVLANDQLALNVTNKHLADIEAAFQTASASIAPVGSVKMWLTGSAPTGWLILDGSNISRTTYSDLFALWGTTFGTGDGSTTFGIPDMRQRIPIGKTAAGTLSTLGATTGSWDHTHGPGTLTVASHTHGPGTLTVAGHTHDSGTLTVAAHTHGPGTLAVASHSHTLSVDTTFTDISHTHNTDAHTHTFTTGGPSGLASVHTASPDGSAAGTAHTHSGTTDTGGGGLTTSAGGSHRHSVTGQSTDATAPAVSGGLTASTAPAVNAGATGSTAPAVNAGATDAQAPAVNAGLTASNNPPVLAVNFIVRYTATI